MASELESDLLDTVDWGRKYPIDVNAEKTQLLSFDWYISTDSSDVKIDGSVLEENSSFKMLRFTFSSKLNWGSYVISIAKRKLELLTPCLMRLLCISINLLYSHARNTVVMSWMVHPVVTWNC